MHNKSLPHGTMNNWSCGKFRHGRPRVFLHLKFCPSIFPAISQYTWKYELFYYKLNFINKKF